MLYRVTHQSIVRSRSHEDGRQVFEAGDTLEPTDAELAAFGDRLVKVEEPMEDFDISQWLDMHYQERISQVKDGAVDEHLDEVLENETSTQVEEAVEERKEMPEFGTAFKDDESEDEEDEEDSEE